MVTSPGSLPPHAVTASNATEMVPSGTMTLAGSCTAAGSAPSVTVVPPRGAGAERRTMAWTTSPRWTLVVSRRRSATTDGATVTTLPSADAPPGCGASPLLPTAGNDCTAGGNDTPPDP